MKKAARTIKSLTRTSIAAILGGSVTAAVVSLYKLAVGYITGFSRSAYTFVSAHPIALPVAVLLLAVIAFVLSEVFNKNPEIKGGGIPVSVSCVKGNIAVCPVKSSVGVFISSLVSFFTGAALGNEGPCVQMGTALGCGCAKLFGRKNKVKTYAAGGGCAGFATVTGSYVSGLTFTLEELGGEHSPSIVLSCVLSVASAFGVSWLVCPVLGVSDTLFPAVSLQSIPIKMLWLPLSVSAFVGLVAVLLLKVYDGSGKLVDARLKKLPRKYLIFAVLVMTLAAGLFSQDFVSTGHGLVISVYTLGRAPLWLLLVLILRVLLTFSANLSGMTGGTFVPVIAIGAVASALFAEVLIFGFGLSQTYYPLIVTFGITACISSMLQMPLTAVAFSLEVLGCTENIPAVLAVSALSYVITWLFRVKSINECSAERIAKVK